MKWDLIFANERNSIQIVIRVNHRINEFFFNSSVKQMNALKYFCVHFDVLSFATQQLGDNRMINVVRDSVYLFLVVVDIAWR